MKKSYINPLNLFLGVLLLPLIIGSTIVFTALGVHMLLHEAGTVGEKIMAAIMIIIFLGAGPLTLPEIWSRTFAKLTLYDDYVKWSVPFRKSIVLHYDEINFAGVDTCEIRGQLSPIETELTRTFASAYIYLSVSSYRARRGDDFKKIFNEEGIIMFRYTDEICLALIEKLPPKRQEGLRGFYYKLRYLENKSKEDSQKSKRRKKK